jgi:hypothetical protein
MKKSVLLIGNLVFIKVETENAFIDNAEPKYMAAAISGGVFSDTIYTYNEIKQQYPGIKELDTLLDIKDNWAK